MTTQPAPNAPQKVHEITVHGQTRSDPYYWLRERDDPAVIEYLDQENRYTNAEMAASEHLREQIFQEFVGRIQETDATYPVRRGPYEYFTRTTAGLQYPSYCRRQVGDSESEQVLLDLNQAAAGHDFLKLCVFKVSPDHKILAYSLDVTGSEHFELRFKDLTSAEVLPDEIGNTSYSGEWASDNRSFYYTTQDRAKRPDQLFRHALGQDQEQNQRLFEEPDALYSLYLSKTTDGQYIQLICASSETSEVHLIDAGDPQAKPRVIQPRTLGVRYAARHHSGTLYILTNHEAQNFRLMKTMVAQPSLPHWVAVRPYDDAIFISSITVFADFLVLYQREQGFRTIEILEFATEIRHTIEFPDAVYTYSLAPNPGFGSQLLQINYSSLITPGTVYEYDMAARQLHLRKREPILGGFDTANYQTERIYAQAKDGVEVPISLAYRKGISRDGLNPCFLYGYGSYGASMDPSFRSDWLSLMDRGFVVAIAHIRGGQEMGRQWYEAGKYLHKINTFSDFIACGRHLISERYTQSERLAIYGRSAGGLLIGAVLNVAPDLCQTAVAGVPFMDVVTTMLDESIPLTVGEFEEWGNPSQPDFYDYMLSYSPYDNLKAGAYPHVLVTAGLNDSRVQYWEPAKWVARLRDLKTDDHKLLLQTNMGAGHSGASGRYDYLREQAFIYSFVLDSLGLE